MTTLLLAKGPSGRAKAVSTEQFIAQTGGKPRAMMAAMLSLRFEKPILFATDDDLWVVQQDDPQIYDHSYDALQRHALKFSEFVIRDGVVQPEIPGKMAPTWRLDLQSALPVRASLLVAALSADEAKSIVEAELERVQELPLNDAEDDPFWKLIHQDIGETELDPELGYIDASSLSVENDPERVACGPDIPIDFRREDEDDDDE